MRKITILFFLLVSLHTSGFSQTVTDFTKKDCSGNTHNFFDILDSGNVVILEFFHTCLPCKDAAQAMLPMYQKLKGAYGNKVRFFGMPEDDSFDCSQVLTWVSVNGLTTMVTPFDSGSVQTAYYGGMGMPTVAVVAGSGHKVLYLVNATTAAFALSDTTIIDTAIRNFLDSAFAGISELGPAIGLSLSPNPAKEHMTLSFESPRAGTLTVDITSITGEFVMKLTEERITAGTWKKSFPVSLPNGVYFIKGTLAGSTFNKKFTIQR